MMKLLVAALLLAGAIAGWAFWTSTGPADRTEGPAPLTGRAPASRPEPARPAGPPVAPTRPAPTTARMLRMPDGTQVPMLNGVTELAANPWPGDVPYSPIVGKETDPSGQDWYVHADGTKSTMQMVWRSDLGRHDGVFQVARPGPVLPPGPRGGAAAPDSKPADR